MRLWLLLLFPALVFANVCAYQSTFESLKNSIAQGLALVSPTDFNTQPCFVYIYKYLEDVFLTYPSWDPNIVYRLVGTVLDSTERCDFVEIWSNLTTPPFALSGLALATKLNVSWEEPLNRFMLYINATKGYFGWQWVVYSPSTSLWLVEYGTTYKDLFTTMYILLVLKSLGINVTKFVERYTPGVLDVATYALKYNVGAFTDRQLAVIVPELYVMALKLGFLNLSDVCQITLLILNSRGLDTIYTSTELTDALASAGVPFWYMIAKWCYENNLIGSDDYIRIIDALDYYTEYHLQNDISNWVAGDVLRLYMYYAYRCEYNNTEWPIDYIFKPVQKNSGTPITTIIYNITNVTSITSVTSVTSVTNITSVTQITNVTTIVTTIVYSNTTIITTVITSLVKLTTYAYQQPMDVSPIFLLIPLALGAIRAMSKENAKRSVRRS